MTTSNATTQMLELVSAYEGGLYTKAEVTSRAIAILHSSQTREELWNAMPRWLADGVSKLLERFDERIGVVTFGAEDSRTVQRQMVEMQRWLAQRGA
jgi:hypothetical protein